MNSQGPRPDERTQGLQAYRPPAHTCPVDLLLDANEGAAPPAALLAELQALGPDLLRRYPDRGPLERLIAARLGEPPERVLVTAGGDEAIDRLFRAYLGSGRELVLPVPTFEMLARYARLAGGEVVEVPWPGGAFPVGAVLERIGPATAVVAVVSPNNPTGAVASGTDLARLAAAAPEALLLVDLAYAEFASEDLTAAALALPNAVAIRSFSKAWGLAGLRVGYAAGPAGVIAVLRGVGGPYSVSRITLALAARRLEAGGEEVAATVGEVCRERALLAAELERQGARVSPSEANFVLAEVPNPRWLGDALAGQGVAVRTFDNPALQRAVRIACPGEPALFERLLGALRVALGPQALLFDLDGVLADVSRSYRRAIIETAASFGVALGAEEVSAAKRRGGANNDWALTARLCQERGRPVALDEVTRRFEDRYQRLADQEMLIPDAGLLERLAARLPLAVVTGRPRRDARRFLERHGIAPHVAALVAMEDAPLKPDPAPVRLACDRLGIERAWMIGDTPDDVRAARAAGAVPLGVVAPNERAEEVVPALHAAGAGRVLRSLGELEELLP